MLGQGWQVGQREEPRRRFGVGGVCFWLTGRCMNISGDRTGRIRKHTLPSELPRGEMPSYHAGKEPPSLTMESSRILTAWLNSPIPYEDAPIIIGLSRGGGFAHPVFAFCCSSAIFHFSFLFEQNKGGHRPDCPGHPGVLPYQGEAHGVRVSVQEPTRWALSWPLPV